MGLLQSLQAKAKEFLTIDPYSRAYIEFNKRKWSSRIESTANSRKVVLVDRFDDAFYEYTYPVMAHAVAKTAGARLASFYFHRSRIGRLGLSKLRVKSIYDSIGARLEISFKGARRFRAKAEAFAEKEFARIRNKEDVLEISLGGINLGTLVYQTYLRDHRATMDVQDPELKRIIADAYLIFRVSEEYFENHDVQAVFISHSIFIYFGIIARIAGKRGIPVYRFFVNEHEKSGLPLVPFKLDPVTSFQEFPYWNYREDFARLDAAKQQESIGRAKGILEGWLNGTNVFIGYRGPLRKRSPWGVALDGERVLRPTNKPKIVVLLSCFFDGPHFFRHSLFPDFYEWITYVLKEAEKTDFEWYVKPHPAGIPKNLEVIRELMPKFPKAILLPAQTSNKAIVAEKPSAVFNMHGTAIHEFSYLGIPVVTAGDCMPIAYDFFLKPKSVAELSEMIRNADKLRERVSFDKDQIAEFIYMNYIEYFERRDYPHIAAKGFMEFLQKECGGSWKLPKMFDFLTQNETPEMNAAIERFFADFHRESRAENLAALNARPQAQMAKNFERGLETGATR